MRLMRITAALGVAALALAGCEDITNPVEEFGRLEDPYVRFETSGTTGTPGSTNLVIFQLPTRLEDTVDISFSFGGDAVFGTDFVVVDEAGNPRTDVNASGGSAVIPFVAGQTTIPRDTLIIFVPFAANDGRKLEIVIESAVTRSGRELETGFVDQFRTFDLSIEGFVDMPIGTYAAARDGDFGTATGTVTITKPATPPVVDGVSYDFVISDVQGNPSGIFGVPVPWAFSVTSGGTVVAPRLDVDGLGVTADVVGTFDFDTNTLSYELVLDCCGAAGFGWTVEAVLQ